MWPRMSSFRKVDKKSTGWGLLGREIRGPVGSSNVSSVGAVSVSVSADCHGMVLGTKFVLLPPPLPRPVPPLTPPLPCPLAPPLPLPLTPPPLATPLPSPLRPPLAFPRPWPALRLLLALPPRIWCILVTIIAAI